MSHIKANVMYPALAKEHKTNKKFSVEFVDLTPDQVTELEDMGLNVREHEDKGHYILAQSGYKPKVFDTKGNPVPDEIVRKIGNGSKLMMFLKTYETEYQKKKFTKLALSSLTLLKLVEYSFGPELEEDENFVVEVDQDESEFLEDEVPF